MPGFSLRQAPAAPPPPDVAQNIVGPPSQANMPRIFTYVTLPPMILFLMLRMYARLFVTRKVWVDDYLCLLASVSHLIQTELEKNQTSLELKHVTNQATLIVYTVLLFTILDNPSGPQIWDVPASNITVYYVRTSVLTPLLFVVAAMFAKTAVLALYQRIFGRPRRSQVLILCGIVFNVVFYISILIIIAVGCTPQPEDYATGGWLSPQYNTRCHRYMPATTATSGVVGAVIDVYILLLPLFFVWELQISTQRKAGLAAIFIVGSSACVFSIVSAYYRFTILSTPGNDLTRATMPIYSWSIAEINIGILCSCIPVAFVVFKGMAERFNIRARRVWYKFTDGYRRTTDPRDSGKSPTTHMQPLPPGANDGPKLPQVPKATITGLRTVLDKFGRSNAERTRATLYRDDLNLTVMSVDYDYHKHLRAVSTDRQL